MHLPKRLSNMILLVLLGVIGFGCKLRKNSAASEVETTYTGVTVNPWKTKDTYWAEGENFFRRACPAESTSEEHCTVAGPIEDLKGTLEKSYKSLAEYKEEMLARKAPPPLEAQARAAMDSINAVKAKASVLDQVVLKIKSNSPAVVNYTYDTGEHKLAKPNPEADVMADIAKEFNHRFPESSPTFFFSDTPTRSTWFYYHNRVEEHRHKSVCPTGFHPSAPADFGTSTDAIRRTIERLHEALLPKEEFFSAAFSAPNASPGGKPVKGFTHSASRNYLFFDSEYVDGKIQVLCVTPSKQ